MTNRFLDGFVNLLGDGKDCIGVDLLRENTRDINYVDI